jgi:hypothetical protein
MSTEPVWLEAPQYVMWRAEFNDLCHEQTRQNEQAGVPINASILQGLENYMDVNQQILCDPVIFLQDLLCAQRAWDHIPTGGPIERFP